ncbi:hypothetical protein PR048_023808 [Dryococelus australis]|uniref:Uncharacterized protein n=1 Tax=Dryococelus australis TaxID=614101 RepID=A0ABQ9GV73_9NEOP|nr:hypothetical protein PR048_023808 [Dryococelus australis]
MYTAYQEALFMLEHNVSGREGMEWQRARLLRDLEAIMQKRKDIAAARERRLEERPQSDEDDDSWLEQLENALFEQEAVSIERQNAYIILYNSHEIRERIDGMRLQACPTSEIPDQRVLLPSNI